MDLPWRVRYRHRSGLYFVMVRIAACLSAGHDVDARDTSRLRAFARQLRADGLVIHYEPRTLQGWWLVPRREGIDLDLIREPGRSRVLT